MLNDSWAGRKPTWVVVPIEEEEEAIFDQVYKLQICSVCFCPHIPIPFPPLALKIFLSKFHG
jgi:hypothetical protein